MYNKTLFCPTSFHPVGVPVVWFFVTSVVSRPHVVYLTPKEKCVLLSKRGVVATLRPYIYKVELRFYIRKYTYLYIYI